MILYTHGSWLPGDPRGFRVRNHRIHSSGDYNTPPPDGEHAGLYCRNQQRAPRPVVLPRAVRPALVLSIRTKCEALESRVLAIAAGKCHVHLLVEATDNYREIKRITARIKQASSHAVRDGLPGRVWAGGGKPIRVHDQAHQRRVFHYICEHRDQGAYVWRFDEQEQGA
ncbi:MAG: transposase [Phycisphaeraceae bacterium]